MRPQRLLEKGGDRINLERETAPTDLLGKEVLMRPQRLLGKGGAHIDVLGEGSYKKKFPQVLFISCSEFLFTYTILKVCCDALCDSFYEKVV